MVCTKCVTEVSGAGSVCVDYGSDCVGCGTGDDYGGSEWCFVGV